MTLTAVPDREALTRLRELRMRQAESMSGRRSDRRWPALTMDEREELRELEERLNAR
jgi:hypothetical protein